MKKTAKIDVLSDEVRPEVRKIIEAVMADNSAALKKLAKY